MNDHMKIENGLRDAVSCVDGAEQLERGILHRQGSKSHYLGTPERNLLKEARDIEVTKIED